MPISHKKVFLYDVNLRHNNEFKTTDTRQRYRWFLPFPTYAIFRSFVEKNKSCLMRA